MIDLCHRYIIPAAYAILPPRMNSPKATAMLLSIGLHESNFVCRRQGNNGPARGLLQFEKAGIRGVAQHESTRDHLKFALASLQYQSSVGQIAQLHAAIEHNDVLMMVCGRLLLWSLPARLPERADAEGSFLQYVEAWRPGAYTRGTDAKRAELQQRWNAEYARAWDLVEPPPEDV